MEHRRSRHVAAIFVAGLLAALPLAATLLIVAWGAQLVYRFLGPDSPVGRVLSQIGVNVGGSAPIGYAIGVAVVLAGIFVLGLLVQTGLQRGFAVVIDAVVRRIPIVRNVYHTIQRFVELLARRDGEGLGSMTPVWCHFGGAGGAATLALLSSPEAVMVGDRACVAVLVPTAPIPIGGGLIYVPREWITPAAIGVDALTSIYVSMGVTSTQFLRSADAPADGTR